MITIDNIPYFKVYKQKVLIPRNEDKIGFGCVAILNNRNLDDSLKIFNHPKLVTKNSKYFNFYIDKLYREKIYTKQYRLNNKKYQDESYEKIKNVLDIMRTPIKMDTINKKNFFYDLSVYNDLYFNTSSTATLKKRIEIYFKYINKIINNPILQTDYSNKVIYMSTDSWIINKKDMNNPIMFIYLAAKRFPDLLKYLGDINIVIYSSEFVMKLNPIQLNDKENFNLFRIELNKLIKNIPLDDEEIDKEIEKDTIKMQVKSSQQTGIVVKATNDDIVKIPVNTVDDAPVKIDDETKEIKIETEPDIVSTDNSFDEEFQEKMDEKINDELEKFSDEEIDLSSDEIADKIKNELDKDKELIGMMHDNIQTKKTGKSTASIKRDEELREKQKQIKIANKSLSEYMDEKTKDFNIESFNIDDKIVSTNDNVKELKFTNFEKSYNEKVMKADTIKIFQNLNDKSIPTYIKDIKITDSSDELNYKDTYNVILEDQNRVRHSLTFDVPKFIDDKFLYLNGNKKIITKQLFMKPIVKTAPDTVQICSNYNKIFIRRYGPKMSPKLEKFKRAITIPVSGLIIKNGDNRSINSKYKTILEYDSISENILSIKTKDFTILFNQEDVKNKLGSYKLNDDDFCIGFYKDETPILMSYKDEVIKDTKTDIIDFILNNAPTSFKNNFDSMKSGTSRYTYSRATIMTKDLPILLLVGYCEGITEVLRKGNIKHYFSDTNPKISDNEGVVKFADGYLVYDRYPYENSLLLNAFSILPTQSINYEEFDEKEIYVELFYELFKARNLANAFDSFYEFMIDPITKEVLEDLDYPTDFVSVVLFANSLLADNSYIMENNMNLYRIRSNEIVNAIIHKQIADAYAAYRASANNTNPVKISIPKDIIIKKILSVNTVEEFSTLNPIYESDKLRSITPKGVNGMNSERAFTSDKRSYDKTMLGVLGMSTSPDANVGVVRKLTMEPNIVSPRGYIDINDESNQKDINIFTAGEMLTPMGATHDDSVRTAMASKQSSHIIPVTNASPVLISNGSEQSVQYTLSKDFIITAEDDGEVVENDQSTGLVIIKYKNGKTQAVDTNPRVLKNSSSGFYLSNKLNCDLKLGDKVKKNDILGYEDKFFTNDAHNKNRFNIGSLEKIAIMSSYSTFEDSTFITKKMSKDMASDIVMMTDVTIGKNSNVGHIVKIGDNVEVGDVLVEFDTSFEEEGLNKFLSNISDDLKEEIKSLGKVPIKTKYSGIVEDIKIYSSVELDELSPSLKKIVSAYYTGINKKKKLLEKYDDNKGIVKAGILFNEPTGKIKPSPDGKIKGRDVFDGVLIEFYIKYFDPMAVGDKMTFYSALKSIVGEVIDDGLEPYSEFRPDEEISAFLGPAAILARMVPSALLVMFGNKILIELKRKLEDIYKN